MNKKNCWSSSIEWIETTMDLLTLKVIHARLHILIRQFIKYCVIFKEYVHACRNVGNNSDESALKEKFDIFDVNKDGNIDMEEFFFATNFLMISKRFVNITMDEVRHVFQDSEGSAARELLPLEDFIQKFREVGSTKSNESLTRAHQAFSKIAYSYKMANCGQNYKVVTL